jgi:hypothetical protein
MLYSCAPITNRFSETSIPQIEKPELYTKHSFNTSDMYAIRLTREVKLKYESPRTQELEYSDTPYPVYKVVVKPNDSRHVIEENYFILNGLSSGKSSGTLLFLSSYYLKDYSLQEVCFNKDFYTTYAVQSAEFGKWNKQGDVVTLVVSRGKETVHFKGTVNSDKLVILETEHPKQNPSSLYANEQPLVAVKDILNLEEQEGLIFLSQAGRKLLYPDWDALSWFKIASGKRLQKALPKVSQQSFNELWLNTSGQKGRQFILVDTQTKQAVRYKKKITCSP